MASKLVKLNNIRRALTIQPNEAQSYLLAGRISRIRTYRSKNFVDLTDGSDSQHIQTVISKDILNKPQLNSYILCRGKLTQSPGAKQAIEFKVDKVEFLGECEPDSYPLTSAAFDDHLSYKQNRHYTHLRPRMDHFSSLLRVRSELELAIHMIMKQMDFFKVHTPILSGNDSEASSDLFQVQRRRLKRAASNENDTALEQPIKCDNSNSSEANIFNEKDQKTMTNLTHQQSSQFDIDTRYFNRDVYLVTSGQLHLECLAAALSRVYCLSNTFRAENSLTRRHLCEFSMLEAEESDLVELDPLMDRVETIIKFLASYMAEISDYKLDFLNLIKLNSNEKNFEKLQDKSFIRMTYSEAMEILRYKAQQNAFEGSTKFGSDIGRLHERKLLEFSDNVPIFITNYPKHLKAFYMKCCQKDELALCFDLIAPFGGEICGGSLREECYNKLVSNLRLYSDTSNDTKSKFDWYLDLRRFGTFPHGGFGLGFERLVQSLLGVENIKNTLAFPRWPGYCPM